MSEAKFNPAPWEIHGDGQVVGSKGNTVCLLFDDDQFTDGNAYLIAAAPELYRELFDLLDALASTPELNLGSWGIDTDSAKAALAKAKGE